MMPTSDFIHSLSFSSLSSCLSFFSFHFLVTVLIFHIHCLVITNANFLLVRLQPGLLKEKKKEDGGFIKRRSYVCVVGCVITTSLLGNGKYHYLGFRGVSVTIVVTFPFTSSSAAATSIIC